MYHIWNKKKKTAPSVSYIFSLAVFFFFCFTPAEILLCHLAQAVNLQMPLEEKDRGLVRFGEPIPQVGLSISYDSIPLLKTNLSSIQTVQVDYEHQLVSISEKLGGYQLQKPLFLTLPAYTLTSSQLQTGLEWKRNLSSHFVTSAEKAKGLFEWEIPVKFPKMVSRIIGEGGPGLKVSGYRRISFSGRSMWEEGLVNTATSRQSKFPSLNMEQQSAFSITGTIGSKISVKVDQDSRRNTDLQNTLQLRYQGEDDEIIQTIEAGNTNLSVGSGTVGYGETKQGLFGIKTTAKVAGWNLTMITSQDKGSTEKAEFKAGAETKSDIIRDYEYLERTFYYLGTGFTTGDSIVEIKLFKSNTAINSNTAQNPAPYGIAYVKPEDTLATYPEGIFSRRFQEIDPNDYFIQREQYWIQFFRTPEKNDILATYYIVRHADPVSYDTVGFVKDSCTSAEGEICMWLKLLKPDTPKPTDYTWEYEWKNVYFLNSRYIEREGFRLDIYKGDPNAEKVTEDKNYQDSTLYLRLFGLDQLDLNAEKKPDGIVDYRQIDFGLGYLIFPNLHPFAPIPSKASYTGNDADTLKVRVESIYSSNQLQDRVEQSKYYIYVQSASRKAQYSLGHAPIIEGSDVVTLNGTPLKRDEDYTITYETGDITFLSPEALSPTANLSVDYDYAPLLSPEKKSMFGMMAEYNLGTNFKFGTVGIYKSDKTSEDRPRVGQEPSRNFVWGSNLTFNSSPPILTRMLNVIPWVKTEAPSRLDFRGDLAQSIPNPNTSNQAFIDDFEGSLEYTDLSVRRGVWALSSPPLDKNLSQRCRMWWYNPYDQVLIKDIWPNKEAERNAERTNVLELKFFPQESHQPSNPDFNSDQAENSWNGIMRPLYPGAYDQTRTKFLEVWVWGDKGILHVDLGEISEDLNGDKILNTEDKPRNGQRDGILDDDEDLGLDTLDDSQEPGYGPSMLDPAGDNWYYSERYIYSQINGTQGNREDPDRGRRPDTEDINSNSTLDLTSSYFEFDIDLSKTEFLGDMTDSTGWRLYRIPLKDPANYKKVGEPDWTDIRFARLWISSAEICSLRIASIQMVGNRWQNLGISSLTSRQTPLPIGTSPDEDFEVFVVNTHENPSYEPPPKVAGTLNRQTGVREREQSLVLKYNQLKPYHQGSAYRILLYQPEDYTSYRHLNMFVHGPDDPEDVMFFFRLGSDSSNYYEYHTPLYPGWDERNEVKIDFEQVTALKAYALNSRPSNSVAPIDTSTGTYRVRGNPTLKSVRWFNLGVVNVDTVDFQPVSGEVWVDEMRVTGVRKEKGLAGSMTITATLADLGNLSFSYKQQDSQYRSLTAKAGSGTTTLDYRMSLSGFQLHRFIPVSLGYLLPVSLGYSRTLDLPKWKSGSDIILPKELREKEKRESVTKSIGFSPIFNHPTKNWLIGLTLKRLTHSINYGSSWSTSLLNPVQKSTSTSMNGGYTFPFGKRREIKPFGWLKGSLIPKSFTQMGFTPFPDNVQATGSISEARSHSENNVGVINDSYTRGFNGNLSASASFIKSLPLKYSMSTGRDLTDPQTIKYSLIPKNAKLGIETRYSETFSTSYAPSWLAFLNAKFDFSSGYNENSDRLDNRNFGNTRTIGNDNTRVANFTLDWVKLLGSAKKEEKKQSILNPFNWLRKLTRRIDPVSVNYRRNQTFSKSGLLARPTLSYRLGFTEDPKVGREGPSQSADRVSIADAYSAKSGISILSTHIGMSYSKNVSRNIATEATKSISTRFPDLGFSFNKLGNFKYFKKFFTAITYNFGYFKQVEQRGNERTGETISRVTSQNFSPLASFSLDWKKGIRTSIKYAKDIKTDENLKKVGGNQSITRDFNNSINVSNSYSFSAPHGIKLPFLRKIKFNSNLSLSLNISKSSKKTKSSVGGNPFNVTADNSRFSLTASSGYSFSSQVTGGVNVNWADTNDKKTKRKTHTRELGIFMQISF